MRRFAKISGTFAFFIVYLSTGLTARAENCALCGAPLTATFYLLTDKLTDSKVHACHDCTMERRVCYLCGLPARVDHTDLSDGRVLCARDAKTAIIEPENGKEICRQTRDRLDQLLSRFMTFPEKNVTLAVVDRVNLLELFKFAGNDYQCPNVWGYEQTQTNRQHSLEHAISIMSGLSAVGFKATCAHEYTHAWLDEHLSPARSESLSRDSNEAFCELIAYLLMNSLGETEAVNQIKRNAYTRGQILLFIEAEQRFGVSDVIDWVQYGTDSSLREGELARVRSVELPRNGTPRSPAARPAPIVFADPPPSTAPDTLILKGISGTRARPMALINDATFEANEKGKVRLGKTNVTIRCLSISAEAVRIQLVGSNQEQELRLRTTHP